MSSRWRLAIGGPFHGSSGPRGLALRTIIVSPTIPSLLPGNISQLENCAAVGTSAANEQPKHHAHRIQDQREEQECWNWIRTPGWPYQTRHEQDISPKPWGTQKQHPAGSQGGLRADHLLDRRKHGRDRDVSVSYTSIAPPARILRPESRCFTIVTHSLHNCHKSKPRWPST